MKFTDGYWLVRPGFAPLYAVEVDDIRFDEPTGTMNVYARTIKARNRGDLINHPLLTVSFSAEAEGVIRTKIEHYAGRLPKKPRFELTTAASAPVFASNEQYACLTSGALEVRVYRGGPWRVEYWENGRLLTSSLAKSVAAVTSDEGGEWIHEQLAWQPGESIYGLGERFGPLVKNGQAVEIWNEDGGTQSEQAYKNVPFYLSSRGYGVLVDTPARVSFEVGSEVNTRVQFSVTGQSLEYLVIAGPTMKDALGRYTALTGRAPQVPAWSYGPWLSTSFTTDYDEKTVTSFIGGMMEREIPLSVFHFDAFWMREHQWVDFTWDERMFPDPAGMLARLKAKGVRICVWINPYVGQRSAMFAEGAEKGYLLRTVDGDVWQWDLWQPGMGIVDFTNPEVAAWYTGKLRALLDQGVDCFKTDFGERIPWKDVAWFDGADGERMHNYYTELYNRAVFDLLKEVKGEGEAVVFARSATAGGQKYPVHWGGDCDSSFGSMAESLRGGLSLGLSGFGYWSHDIGGFEDSFGGEAGDSAGVGGVGGSGGLVGGGSVGGGGEATGAGGEGVGKVAGCGEETGGETAGGEDVGTKVDVFKRWVPFGLLSSHSRFHGSHSYRVPWAYGEEAVEVTRKFAQLKMRLMPYLMGVAREVTEKGLPLMRAMVLEFPEDRSAHTSDTQYMLGGALCVSPVLSADGRAETYLPEGTWRHLLTEEAVQGSRWVSRQYGFDSLGLFVRPGCVVPLGAMTDVPEYAWAEDVTLLVSELADGALVKVHVPGGTGAAADFVVSRRADSIEVRTENATAGWAIRVLGSDEVARGVGAGSVALAAG